MSISILSVLDIAIPLGVLDAISLFAAFYIEAERLVTLAQNRDTEVLRLYDVVLDTIDNSLLSNSTENKTWISDAYITGKNNTSRANEIYYLEVVYFVRELQLIVLLTYDTVDAFYVDTGITVSQTFADISEDAGYPISPQYIEDIS